MLVDVGTLRFTIPDNARDRSTYLFRRGNSELVSVEIESMPASMSAQDLFARRLAPLEKYLGHPVSVRRPVPVDEKQGDVLLAELDLSEVDAFVGLAFGRLDAAAGFAVRYGCPLAAPPDHRFFADMSRTVSRSSDLRPLPSDWIGRRIQNLTFGLPSQFTPCVSYGYGTDDWLVRIEHVDASAAWRAYFAIGDELRVDPGDESTIEIGPARMAATSRTSRVRRHRVAIVHDGAILSPAVLDEHVLREAAFACAAGKICIFGTAKASCESVLDDVWHLLLTSIVSSTP